MIYQILKPLMIVGYLLSILAPLSLQAAPGDSVPGVIQSPSINQSPVTPITNQAITTAISLPAVEANSVSAPNPESSAPLANLKPVVTETISPSESASINPVEANNSSVIQADVPSDIIAVKSVQGLAIPAQSQSKIIPTSQQSDVRVIIDISGSMKENDQNNIRIPALNLIVEMLPEGAQAGVWTFGQWVNMLIPPAKVDEAWREKAKQESKKINSHGLRTNIGEAMEKALWKFEANGTFDQHTILLTDGLVDIAKDSDPEQQQKNESERQRIMTKVLKQYQALGVKIHTIALSDKADKILLEKLALETGGSSHVVNNSEELVKAFLKAFEQAAPEVAEQVPLSDDNTFEIDASVEEFTALIFRKAGSVPTQLVSPSGKVISQIKSSENAKWFGESVYDLVTLTAPEAGQWKIQADLDPDNRVTVVSDLKMEIANLPNTLFPGQQVDFEVYLHENSKVISNPDFLKLMSIEMTMTAENGRSGTKAISDPDNIPADGRYKESIKRLSKEGQYELKVSVDGKTFQRMRKEYIQVRQPIGFEIRKRIVGTQEAYAVRVIPQVPDIEVARTRVIAKLKSPDGTSIIQAMPWVEEGVWEAVIEPNKGPGEYNIAMNVKGRFGKDQEFRIKPGPISLMFPIPADFSHEYYVQEEAVDSMAAEEQETKAVTQEADVAEDMPDLAEKMKQQEADPAEAEMLPKEEDQAESETVVQEQADEATALPSWVFILIPVLTILLGVGGFFGYRVIAKKKAAKNMQAKPAVTEDTGMKGPDISLNDGMDDEDFDEDFDLSDDDDDEEIIGTGGDLDDLDGLDLSNDDQGDDEMDDFGDMPDLDEEFPDLDEAPQQNSATEEVSDDIPDFDENFDIDADVDPVDEAEPEIKDTPEETAAALDELDSVLDDLSSEDEANIPQLDADEAAGDAPDEALEGEAAIDAALADLETELDDLDLGNDK